MHLLLIEDDRKTAKHIARNFSEKGLVCDVVQDGRAGLEAASSGRYDVVIVDRMLPELDGLSLVKALRLAHDTTPVIYLTALGGIDDRVAGLEAGADDYLTKPFAFSELAARVRALTRRNVPASAATILRVADLEMDLVKRTVQRAGEAISLQKREFLLLEVLLRSSGQILTRSMLLEQVWDIHFDPKTSIVETHISRLRAKIDKPFDTPLLHTVRNCGYTIRAPA
ncbi:response regulator transcription factor [Acidihalobacter ferrooxydans]|uniref:DNA-binding response regulator n=1 Tax=Acidihalobacter ferrooxydans TaxID=1765967 RepID=A0A1P8UKQ7_9GAMM|nr:response regulator transcription factor [Acidihalobacter ferrooxydans]APZ44364.1 DNA-binding response regulator [Acidihalobacter ferrooxydans]